MSKIRVLFEAGPMLDSKKTGVGYYVSHLFGHLQNAYSDKLSLTGYYFNFLNRRTGLTTAYKPLHFHTIWLVPGKILSVCRRLGFQPFLEIFVRRKSDVVVFTNYVSLPLLRRRKTILTVYDLSFLDVPEYTQKRNLTYLRRFCPPSIRRADVIITISEFTKKRIEHYFPDIKANIVVTPIPPAEIQTNRKPLPASLTSQGITEKSYVLYVGTIEPRKNLQTLIAAFAQLDAAFKDTYALVLAGGKGWEDEGILAEVVQQQAKGAKIILTGYVSEDEKSALYSNAACFVLPSHYEGFGMPLLEAMQYGTPTLASDIPVFREVAGNGALYFDKDGPSDITTKINSVLTDDSLSQKLVNNGQRRLKTFSWQENAAKVYEALR